MKRSFLFLGVAAMVMSAFSVPQTFAATPGELFSKLLNVPEMYVTADANISLGSGGDLGMPFDLSIDIYEEGGKVGQQFSGTGTASVRMRNFEDTDEFMGPLSRVDMNMAYDEIYFEDGTSFVRFRDIGMYSDNEMVQEVMEMLNELAKFPANKWMKLSMNDLNEVMESLGMMDPELMALFSVNTSLDAIMGSFGMFLDDMVESGFMEVSTSGGDNAFRRDRGSTGMVHYLTLGSSIDTEGAAIFREGLIDFMSSLIPFFGEEIADDIRREDLSVIASDLNELLAMSELIDFWISLTEQDGRLVEMEFNLDLAGMGIPLSVNEMVTVDYNFGYALEVPVTPSNIIDFAEIIEGMMTITGGVTSAFMVDDYYYDDYGYAEDTWDGAWEVTEEPTWLMEEPAPVQSFGFNPELEYNRIMNTCGRNKQCLELRLTRFSDLLKEEWETGFMSNTEYSRYRKMIREALIQ